MSDQGQSSRSERELCRELVERISNSTLMGVAVKFNQFERLMICAALDAYAPRSELGLLTSVEDALPTEAPKRYLVTNGELWRIAWFNNPAGARHWWDCHGQQIVVTHWMLLPELPNFSGDISRSEAALRNAERAEDDRRITFQACSRVRND